MRYRIIPVTPFQQNCTLLWCEQSLEAAVVDPGGDLPNILREIERQRVRPTKILLTHGHVDHVGGAGELAAQLAIPIEGPHIGDDFWLRAVGEQGRMFGLGEVRSFTPDRWLTQGDRVLVGDLRLDVLHCPGHTPGHLVFFDPASRIALVGDVLFQGSIGRTDFPRGDYDQLIGSIRSRLWPLGDDVHFIPGHGPMSTFGEERRSNPFVADRRG
jgi:glyoxylase-like metal-dependent hydrolase (beta-lactamase superfamily II)